jgi:hypothetical protein
MNMWFHGGLELGLDEIDENVYILVVLVGITSWLLWVARSVHRSLLAGFDDFYTLVRCHMVVDLKMVIVKSKRREEDVRPPLIGVNDLSLLQHTSKKQASAWRGHYTRLIHILSFVG